MQPESLPDIMKFDHGYTASSPPIRNVSRWPCPRLFQNGDMGWGVRV